MKSIEEENEEMKKLLRDILPDIKWHLQHLIPLWPAREILTTIHRYESHIHQIENFIKEQEE